ncbi:putative neck protein [Vibrio phage 277E43-1]|nr:putative neck protein [Vibrio phage 277E43-1]
MEIDCKVDMSGFDAVVKDLNTLGDYQVEWGYPDDTKHPEEPTQTIAQIAYWQEVGVKAKGGGKWKNPPRPFMSISAILADSEMRKYNDQVMLSLGKGTSSVKNSLDYVAKTSADTVRESIETQNFTPLAKSTITQKQSDTILIDSGVMYDAAKGVVVPFVVEDFS